MSFIQRGTKKQLRGYIVDLMPKSAEVRVGGEDLNVVYGKLKAITSRNSNITWKGVQRFYDKNAKKYSRMSSLPDGFRPYETPRNFRLQYHFGYRKAIGLLSIYIANHIGVCAVRPDFACPLGSGHGVARNCPRSGRPASGAWPIVAGESSKHVGCVPSSSAEKNVEAFVRQRQTGESVKPSGNAQDAEVI